MSDADNRKLGIVLLVLIGILVLILPFTFNSCMEIQNNDCDSFLGRRDLRCVGYYR